MLAAVRSGAAMVVLPRFDRDAVLAAVEEWGVTVWPGVPAMFTALSPNQAGHPGGWLRCGCASPPAPLPDETAHRWRDRFGLPLRQLYECSEVSALTINLDGDPETTAASVGRPLKGVELVVARVGRALRPRRARRIWFTSEALADGYVDDPQRVVRRRLVPQRGPRLPRRRRVPHITGRDAVHLEEAATRSTPARWRR